MDQYCKEINAYIDGHKEEIIAMWRDLVNLESHYDEKENVEKARDFVQKAFEAEGFECHVQEIEEARAGVLIGTLGADRPGKPILFIGHIDTVHHQGAFGRSDPFEIRDGKAYGPGVLDMKGGVILALYVVKALNSIGYDACPLKIVFACEEESDHVNNNCDEIFVDECKGGLCAFCLETGHIENRLCVGRKSIYTLRATIHGIGGHAGNEFTKGRNAVHEAIHKCDKLMALTNLEEGTTATVSMIDCGGNTISAAIPSLSHFTVDFRIISREAGGKLEKQIADIMNQTFIEGTTTEWYIDKAKMHPFHINEDIARFVDLLNAAAKDNGFEPFGTIELGGSSDAGEAFDAGVPVVCSAGPIGEFNHSLQEYAVVDSMFNRSKIYAMAILRMKDSI